MRAKLAKQLPSLTLFIVTYIFNYYSFSILLDFVYNISNIYYSTVCSNSIILQIFLILSKISYNPKYFLNF